MILFCLFCPRLLGVNRVVIYNTSCGPDLDRLLQSYSQEGFVEIVSWPIDKYMNPSRGWLFSQYGGDIHYFGQLTTLNECIYRSMERSRYVLLNDIDEIIMPYQHDNLKSLMDELQKQHPKVGSVHYACISKYVSHLLIKAYSNFFRWECSSLRTISFPSITLNQVGGFTFLSGAGCLELIFWNMFTEKTLTDRFTIHTR